MDNNNVLEVQNLTITFNMQQGYNHVIRDVSFHLKRGETLAIVGESGSGKSVTTKSILGLAGKNAIIEGSILFNQDGRIVDLTKLSDKEFETSIRGSKVAIIFQDPMTSLNPTMTVGKQIMESMLIHRVVSNKKDALAQTLKLLALVGIDNPTKRIKQYPHQLSGGMRQRIVIAIALACEPDVLIADEPTTALDVTIQAQIIDLIKDIQQRTGVAIIFITHDLGVVANVADRVAVMYAGQIVEEGHVNEIFYNPQHPYTWGLLSSLPTLTDDLDEALYSIPGAPPILMEPPPGDAFAYRSDYALEIDFVEEPPYFQVTPTHRVKSWLLDERAPRVERPEILAKRLALLKGMEK
ncbi:ABC transporter ATP-binding protein [Paenibacillus sp. R14(2021)]|uniref:ABC transporter ATP-binding protein n=1 Tax=Paenibacillus sp. R14(2021) TaxID=2859228 RepID=UPI001C616AF7|nr:ABC transporter ATP-binding protein [Paenibacillus sp. R14(2021)]